VATSEDYDRFKDLTFDAFRKLAKDETLSQYEKVGFPDSYRKGKSEMIFRDVKHKLKNLSKNNQVVIDIGPGCSNLPLMLIDLCRKQNHTLLLIDSQEMLDHLPDEPFITKVPAYYPSECMWLFDKYASKADVILAYSVVHYVFAEGNLFDFLDRSLSLLAEGGEMLIGDIPNVSKRKRFFSSSGGIRFHQQFTGTDQVPEVKFNKLETGQIDDVVLLSLIARCRSAGFDAYWLLQSDDLPMSNRREDILVRKP